MLLTLDRGNTSLDMMLHAPEAQRLRAPAGAPAPALAALAALAPSVTRAVGSTVVVGGLDEVATLLAAHGVRVELAGVDLPCPLPLAYPDPGTLGTDRWLCALAAHRAHGAALVVQCGTAITVDAVDVGGRFLGGAIAPGLRAMAAGLAGAAPALPRPAVLRAATVPGVTSPACVEAGIVLAFCGAVERLARDVGAALPAAAARLLTGGDAELYRQHGRARLQHAPDLLHRGLRCLAATTGSSS
ncbi:MAG: type III pantothenate kinase [Planctomycetota bacterium]